jgi:hypothetical protein
MDLNGFAQPTPWPQQATGKNTIPCKIITWSVLEAVRFNALVDVTSAPNASTRTYFGVADRRAQGLIGKATGAFLPHTRARPHFPPGSSR